MTESKSTVNPWDWKQVSPTCYERGFDNMERCYKCYGAPGEPFGRLNCAVTTIAGYSSPHPDIVSVFEQAWGYMHTKFPHIAARVDDKKKTYNAEMAEEYKKSTFIVERNKSPRQVFANLDLTRHSILYVFPREQKLMIRSSHDVTDGRGQFWFYHHFFEFVQAIQDGTVSPPSAGTPLASRLAPSFDTMARIDIDDHTMAEAQADFARVAEYTSGIPPHNVGKLPPGDACWQGVQFSERETSDVLRATKARGATVTPVMHAAIIRAQYKYTGEETPYFGCLPVDLRRHCGENATNPLTLNLGVTMRVIQPDSFDGLVQRLVEAYSTVHEDYQRGLIQAFQQMLGSPLGTGGEFQPFPRYMVDLTNPGKVEDFVKPVYGDLEITSIKQQPNEQFYGLFMSTLTFRGKLRASIAYNDQYRMPEEMQRFARLFKQELLTGLGIEAEIDALESDDS